MQNTEGPTTRKHRVTILGTYGFVGSAGPATCQIVMDDGQIYKANFIVSLQQQWHPKLFASDHQHYGEAVKESNEGKR